jgi:hypothetical protein
MRCDGGIMLEPRLQEYIKKKKYYKDNGIEPCVSLEKEYQITNRDKKFLKSFIRGRRDMYKRESRKLKSERGCDRSKPSFPSKKFRDNDPRVPELKNNKPEQPINRGMFYPDKSSDMYYEDPIQEVDPVMDARDFRDISNQDGNDFTDVGKGFDLDDSRFDPRTDPRMFPGLENHDKYKSQYRTSPKNNPLDKFFTQRIIGDSKKNKRVNSLTEDDIFSSEYGRFKNFDVMEAHDYRYLDREERRGGRKRNSTYGEMDKPSFSEKSDMDFDNKIVVPNVSSREKRDLSTFNYRMGPYDNVDAMLRNTELETNMVRGMPDHTKKSYGYRNPAEHYYEYIDDDFQNPNNTDLPFPRGGESTRKDNKALARQKYVREII